jgi:hypothetical protein
MIRVILAAFLYLFVAVSGASALNCAAYPNTLTNGTNADATQVMANFNSILNCANNSLAATSGATFTGPTFFTGGNVGIGTTTPAKLLHLAGSGIGSVDLMFSDISQGVDLKAFAITDRSQTLQFGAQTDVGNNFAPIITLTRGASVGIGTTTPTFTLQVNGSVAGTSAYNNTSDGRLKKDIASLEYGLDTIMKLRPVGFNWITQDQEWKKQHQIGLIAQEVEPVVPEVVTTAKDEFQTKSLAYSELVPILIRAVQDLKADNDSLRAANDSEAARIASLTSRLDAVEAAYMTKAAAASPSRLR